MHHTRGGGSAVQVAEQIKNIYCVGPSAETIRREVRKERACGYIPDKVAGMNKATKVLAWKDRLGVAHFSMLKALKILIFSYSLLCVLILIPP
jgi:hypothetical protein